MSYTDSPIKDNYFYKIIILIIAITSTLKCYSMNNNEIQIQQMLPLSVLYPDQPPPSYEDVVSQNIDILPTYQEALDVIEQANTFLIETENSDISQSTTIDITSEQSDSSIVGNCFCNYFKKNKKNLLIKVVPYLIIITIDVIIASLVYAKIIPIYYIWYFCFISLFLIVVYVYLESYLIKKFITNSG